MTIETIDRDYELRKMAALVATEVLHTADGAADRVMSTAARTATNLEQTSDIWKWLLGAVFTVMVVLFGTAYTQLVNSDAEMKKELSTQRQEYQVLSNNLSTVTANQNMVLQLIRDNSLKLDTLVQRVYGR